MHPTISRYVCVHSTILSDYPTMWPAEKHTAEKDNIYDLTPNQKDWPVQEVKVSGG